MQGAFPSNFLTTIDQCSPKTQYKEAKGEAARGPAAPRSGAASRPIIVVPDLRTALVNSYNVVDFLEGKRFVPAREKIAAGARREKRLRVRHVAGRDLIGREGREIEFEVVPTVVGLSAEEMHSIVAVFWHGATWQFKGWPWEEPTEIFSRIRGYYVRYDDEPIKDSVKSLNVKMLSLAKTEGKRFKDAAEVGAFWSDLERFISSNMNRFGICKGLA